NIKKDTFGQVDFHQIERDELLRAVDRYWVDHIDAMDQLRKGIGLRGYAQQDPVIAYKQEGHEMFEEMIDRIQTTTISRLLKGRIVRIPASAVRAQAAQQAPTPRPAATPKAPEGVKAGEAPNASNNAVKANVPKPIDEQGNFVPAGTPIHRPKK
ncbi:MAG: hypothetical protein ACI4MC_04655, partial [Candidatus Coproplasma sp.]